MKPEYTTWIDDYVKSQNNFVRGACDKATKEMVAAFPELRRVAGFVYCNWGQEEHWWCVAPDGSVVDPTARQFQLVFSYEELDLTDPEMRKRVPTGVCANCGGSVYEGAYFCSDRCERLVLADLNAGRF